MRGTFLKSSKFRQQNFFKLRIPLSCLDSLQSIFDTLTKLGFLNSWEYFWDNMKITVFARNLLEKENVSNAKFFYRESWLSGIFSGGSGWRLSVVIKIVWLRIFRNVENFLKGSKICSRCVARLICTWCVTWFLDYHFLASW